MGSSVGSEAAARGSYVSIWKSSTPTKPLVGAMCATGQTVALGPFAYQGRVSPAQMRAILGVVGQENLRGMAVDGPFLRALGLAVEGEIGVGLGQRAPGRPAGQNGAISQAGTDQADGGQSAGDAVGDMGVVGRGDDDGPGATGVEPFHDFGFDVGDRRLVTRHAIAFPGSSRPRLSAPRKCCTRGGTRLRERWPSFHCRAMRQRHCARPQRRELRRQAGRAGLNTRVRDRLPRSLHRRREGKARRGDGTGRGRTGADSRRTSTPGGRCGPQRCSGFEQSVECGQPAR